MKDKGLKVIYMSFVRLSASISQIFSPHRIPIQSSERNTLGNLKVLGTAGNAVYPMLILGHSQWLFT